MKDEVEYKKLLVRLAVEDNWGEVLKLLNRQLNNIERRERYHHTVRLEQKSQTTGNELGTMISSDELNPEQKLIEKETIEEICNLVCTLGDMYCYLLIRLCQGASLTTIAHEMQVSVATIHNRRERLKKKIKNLENNDRDTK
ncbi:hypothetical protein [Secundilactobacillus mixtipabuli]|uniref:RNA polymerase factor sigma-70 n=1 Tax=Secundilactobacillus mixtipabuli TaxID=1435342 RepID=A0A1Z5ID95_9LACO|nr:hypothetical protein [Secundilactobacillus mixtipabuli]GAW99581.1 RNA polymerase factor sigma-70 [Secundilactobacillus mixtipabuli]